MELWIADTFTSSLGRLEGDEQKRSNPTSYIVSMAKIVTIVLVGTGLVADATVATEE